MKKLHIEIRREHAAGWSVLVDHQVHIEGVSKAAAATIRQTLRRDEKRHGAAWELNE